MHSDFIHSNSRLAGTYSTYGQMDGRRGGRGHRGCTVGGSEERRARGVVAFMAGENSCCAKITVFSYRAAGLCVCVCIYLCV